MKKREPPAPEQLTPIYMTHDANTAPYRISRRNVEAWLRTLAPAPGTMGLFVNAASVIVCLQLAGDVGGIPLLRDDRIPEGRLVLLPLDRADALLPPHPRPAPPAPPYRLTPAEVRRRWGRLGLPPEELAIRAEVPEGLLGDYLREERNLEPWTLARIERVLDAEEGAETTWKPMDPAYRRRLCVREPALPASSKPLERNAPISAGPIASKAA